MTGSCVCGAVSVSLKTKPEFIHECNCGLCRKAGAGWGYFSSSEVTTTGETSLFERKDKCPPSATLHFCKTCGTTTHFTPSQAYLRENPSANHVGVNMKLFAPSDLDGIEVRYPNGAGWSGEGGFEYRRDAITISVDTPY
ncbi:MAG: aldehyde-activating protein [Pseudomonadota bacterium]